MQNFGKLVLLGVSKFYNLNSVIKIVSSVISERKIGFRIWRL